MSGSASGEWFKAYWADVRARAATLAAGSLGMLLLATAFEPGLFRDLLGAIALALLTSGVVDILVGGRLRRDLSIEILETVRSESRAVLVAVGLNASLQESGILEVHRRLPDWDQLMIGAAEILLVPLPRPTQPDQDWAAALQVASQRPVEIEIHVPSEATPHLEALAEWIGEPQPQVLQANLQALPGQLVLQWQGAAPRPGGQLRICTYNGVPGFALAKADRKVALVVPSLGGPRAAERPRCFVLDTSRDDTLSGWIDSQLTSIESEELDLRRIQ